MIAARTLYELGRIKDSGVFKNLSLREIYDEHSKNGVYAILALEVVARDPDISPSDLWRRIKILFKNKFVEEPAESNQGGPDIAFKLWKLGWIVTG